MLEQFVLAYRAHTERLFDEHPEDRAAELVVGDNYEGGGIIQFSLLRGLGLEPSDDVIELGCGTGRLAHRLAAERHRGRYTGYDVVPRLLDYAERRVGRHDFRFAEQRGLTIEEPDRSADVACAFSVFTHLLQEHSYRYIAELLRIVRPGGLVIFSFLDFGVPAHWAVFGDMVRSAESAGIHHNQFLGTEMLAAWVDHLEHAESIHVLRGDEPNIRLVRPALLNGVTVEGSAALGQSVAAIRRAR